jgi:hypothetical protein
MDVLDGQPDGIQSATLQLGVHVSHCRGSHLGGLPWQSNTFQWEHLRLNLPGTKTYKPSQAWISKRRADESLASNFVCFVDNQQVAAASSQHIIEVGHAISTRKSYLGIQDALRKIRA